MANGDDPGYFVLGDSIGQGIAQAGGYDNVTKVGANPQWVLDQINDPRNAARIKGQNIILSSGVTNAPNQMDRVSQQLDALTRLGANHVYVAGTSNSRQDLAGLNASLQDIANARGYTFGGGYQAGKDQIHPASYGDYHKTLLGTATPAADPGVLGPRPTITPGLGATVMPEGATPADYRAKILAANALPGPGPPGTDTTSVGPTGPATRALPPGLGQSNAQAIITGMHGGQDPSDEFVLRIRDLGERSGAMGQPNSISPAGAMGRMQVMPGTAKNPGFGITPARDNSENELSRVGTEYAKALLNKYDGNTTLASAAYNAGYGRVDQWIKQYGDPRKGDISETDWASKIPIKETRDYAARVTGGQLGVPGQSPLVARLATTQTATAGQPPIPGQIGPPVTATPTTPAGSIEAATPGLTLGPGSVPVPSSLTLGSPTNPLQPAARPTATALPPGMNMSQMVAMALLQRMVPPTHKLEPIPHNPFAAGPRFEASPFPAAQIHVMPSGQGVRETRPAGEAPPEIRAAARRLPMPSQLAGARGASSQSLMEQALGDTGEPSTRGRARGAGSESQYG